MARMASYLRLMTAAALTLLGVVVPAHEASAAERVSAKRLMEKLRDREKVKLPPGVVVTGDLVLVDGVSLTARGATFNGNVATLPLPRGTAPSLKRASLRLPDSHFKRSTAIAELSFETFDCRECTFDRDADFHSLLVSRMLLDGAVFRGAATFIAAAFQKELHLSDARFDASVSFAAARINGFEAVRLQTTNPVVIGWDQFGNEWAEHQRRLVFDLEDEHERNGRAAQVREEFRFWRRNFQSLDLEEDAREANYALVKLNRREQFGWSKPNSYAPYVLALASGYGTDPYRPFWVAVVAVIVFAVVFAGIGFRRREGQQTTDVKRRYWGPYGLAFSVQTFVPFLTIPGIKDSDWELRRTWWLEPVEGVVGVAVFGVAAYSAAVTF